jgi:pimeloyl-ACP methyl ester carboxylesterase
LNTEQQRLFVEMARATPPGFLKWGAEAILSWRPSPVTVAVHQIHGDRDRVVPVRRVQADVVVPQAGHLLSLTHPEEVNAFLRRVTEAS